MKMKFFRRLKSNLLFLVCVAFFIFNLIANGYHPEAAPKFPAGIYKYTDTKLKPIDQSPPDSLVAAENRYNKFMDTIKLRRRIKNGNDIQGGNGLDILFIGTQVDVSCDTCGSKWFWSQFDAEMKTDEYRSSPVQRYTSLLGWKLKATKDNILYGPDSVLFHVEHKQAYVRKYAVISSLLKGKNDSVYYKYGEVDEPVKFHFDPYDKSLLIPVSKTLMLTIYYISDAIAIISLCYFLFVAGIFIRFVIDISKGRAFTNKNLRALRLIAITFLLFPLIPFLFNLLLGLIFHSYFTEDVVLSNATWNQAWKSIAVGLTFLMLYKAFRQGKKLKDEQEFTV
jgi:hypothetical protein